MRSWSTGRRASAWTPERKTRPSSSRNRSGELVGGEVGTLDQRHLDVASPTLPAWSASGSGRPRWPWHRRSSSTVPSAGAVLYAGDDVGVLGRRGGAERRASRCPRSPDGVRRANRIVMSPGSDWPSKRRTWSIYDVGGVDDLDRSRRTPARGRGWRTSCRCSPRPAGGDGVGQRVHRVSIHPVDRTLPTVPACSSACAAVVRHRRCRHAPVIVVAGEALVDLVVTGERIVAAPGGAPYNVARAAPGSASRRR